MHFASPSFDASVLELAMAVGAGAAMHVVPTGIYGGSELAALMRASKISHAFVTPAALATIEPAEVPDLGTVIVGGEACDAALVALWASTRKMFNAYGPTEATVMATLAGPCLRLIGSPSVVQFAAPSHMFSTLASVRFQTE